MRHREGKCHAVNCIYYVEKIGSVQIWNQLSWVNKGRKNKGAGRRVTKCSWLHIVYLPNLLSAGSMLSLCPASVPAGRHKRTYLPRNPTEDYTILEPHHPSNYVSELSKACQYPDFEALKLQNVRSGRPPSFLTAFTAECSTIAECRISLFQFAKQLLLPS